MDVGCTLDTLDYRLRLWAPTSASRAISAVAELLALFGFTQTLGCISALALALPHGLVNIPGTWFYIFNVHLRLTTEQ